MKKVNRILIFLLCVAMLLSCWGCQANERRKSDRSDKSESTNDIRPTEETDDTNTTEPSTEQVEPSIDYVTDAYENDYSYMTELYNPETGEAEETEVPCTYRIPQINLSGDDVEQINAELYNTYRPIIEDSVSEIKQEGYPISSSEISYQWAVNGNMLSLVVLNCSWPDFGGHDVYEVYNIDISTGEEVSQDTVLQTAGLTSEAYTEKAKQVLGSAYWSNWEPDNENFKNQDFVDFFNKQLGKTISEENIANSQCYINDKGEICIIASIYSLAGADSYLYDLNMIDFEVSAYYDTEAQCLTSQSQSVSCSPEQAVDIYLANKDVWMQEPEEMSHRVYCLLDLDFDGVPELIDSMNVGSGRYSYNLFYKINAENGTVEEFFSEQNQDEGGVDYNYSDVKLLKAPSGKLFYLALDYLRVNAGEGSNIFYECYMENGIYYENSLFSEYWHADYTNGSDEAIITEYRFRGQDNTQSEYEANTESFYRENQNCNLTWSAISVEEFVSSDSQTQKQLLLDAYRSFGYDGFSG